MPHICLAPSQVTIDIDRDLNVKLMSRFFMDSDRRRVELSRVPIKGEVLHDRATRIDFEVVSVIHYIHYGDTVDYDAMVYVKIRP